MIALGVILLAIGVICFAIPSVTFFTQKRVADAGFFHIDISKPHTIFLNPGMGAIIMAAGVIVLLLAR